ncbi:MAG: ribbon-helix-helix domain-containing protein [Candidatus Bathyarchaeota archaeon]|nr:ribbon-helix-helix domain-containing protein [Candidatus Bathyarchaeota archaeon]
MRTISLRMPDRLLEEIDRLVEQGSYANRTDAFRDAARLLVRSQVGILQGEPLPLDKDELWEETMRDLAKRGSVDP